MVVHDQILQIGDLVGQLTTDGHAAPAENDGSVIMAERLKNVKAKITGSLYFSHYLSNYKYNSVCTYICMFIRHRKYYITSTNLY
jgi:hypothetical protein